MATPTKRSFSDADKANLLKELGTWRSTCVRVCTKAPVGGNVYKLADKLIGNIDTAAETLTGNRAYFLPKPHSTKS